MLVIHNHQVEIHKVLKGVSLYANLPEDMRVNKRYAMIAVRYDGMNLQWVGTKLQDDEEVVMCACANLVKAWAFVYASNRIKANAVILKKLLYGHRYWHNINLNILQIFGDGFKNDIDLFKLASYYSRGEFLKYAGEEVLDDYTLIREIVKNKRNGGYIKYASERLRDDEGLALLAMGTCKSAFKYLSDRVRAIRSIIKLAVSTSSKNFQYLSAEVQQDVEIMKIAVYNFPKLLMNNWAVVLRKDYEFIMKLTTERPWAFAYVGHELQGDFELCAYMLQVCIAKRICGLDEYINISLQCDVRIRYLTLMTYVPLASREEVFGSMGNTITLENTDSFYEMGYSIEDLLICTRSAGW